jgi:uncharacterized protein YjaG (DUF416 family)
MLNRTPRSIDDYEAVLSETIESWSSPQRIAFAAAMAERWFPVYESFAEAESWGDPAGLRRLLEAIWSHIINRPLTSADIARHRELLDDCTPHMDDFGAPEALAACAILADALKTCLTKNNAAATVGTALSGFEAAMPDWVFEPEEQPRLWKHIAVRKELRKQIRLIELIGRLKQIDGATIKSLREQLADPQFAGEPPSQPATTGCSAGITNQQAFEQYRRMLEADLRNPTSLDMPGVAFALLRIALWGGRYSRRRQTIDGSYGRLADKKAHQALVMRQRALDTAVPGSATWDPESEEMIELCYANPHNSYDVRSSAQPHGYGPSLRRLWVEAKRVGQTDAEAWDAIVAWARHRPEAWSVEDRRKKKGQAHTTPALGEHLARRVGWSETGDVEYPWAVDADGTTWRVRLNDFPDDFMYALLIGQAEVGLFHDWPENWYRP